MSGPKCAFNTAAALRRVFIPSNLGTSEYLHVTRIFVPALLAISLHQARTVWTPSPAPSRSGSLFGSDRNRSVVRRVGDEVRRVQVKMARLPRDDEIQEPFVHIFQRFDENGRPVLSHQQRTKNVLAELDLKTHSLQVVEINLPEETQLTWPICKIINKREENERQRREKEKEKKKKALTLKEKTLELNWALAPHDQEHKLKTMQKFLAKGNKVQVVLMKKKNGKARATQQDAQALVDKIVAAANEVKGTIEYKKREGSLMGIMKLNFQGKLQQKVEDNEQEYEEEEG